MRRIVLWAVLGCLLLTVALPAWAAPRVVMTATPANEGRVKHGGWVTLSVELVNHGGDLTGRLEVESAADYPHPEYVVPVALPAGGRKRVPVTLEAPTGHPLTLRLVNDGGEVIDRQTVQLTWLPPGSMMVGVLSGDELGVPALTQLGNNQWESAQVVRLTAATFPDRAALLDPFTIIAISRFDTATLTADQLRALEVWVGRGGTLMLAGGPEWKRTLAPLPPSILPVRVTHVQDVPLEPLGQLAGRALDGQGTVSVGRPVGGQVLAAAADVPLVVTSQAGSGRVVYIAFDPGLTPFVGWTGQAPLYNRLLASGLPTADGWMAEPNWMMIQALQRIPDWGLPGVWAIALLLGSYLVLIGPVNYLLLKRVDRREWSWVTVPALSLLYLLIIYGMGFGRYQPLISHLITVTELYPGTAGGTITSYVGVYAPTQRNLAVDLADARLVKPLHQGPVQGSLTARVTLGDVTRLELLALSNYGMSGFQMEQDLQLNGGLELLDGRLADGMLTGRLKNRLDLPVDGLVLAGGGGMVEIGRLEAGATSEPFSLPLANQDLLFDPRKGVPAFAFGMDGSAPMEYGRTLVRDYVTQAAAYRRGSGLIVYGWTDRPPAAPRLPDLGKLVTGTNLVYALVPLPVGGDQVEVPPGQVVGRPTDPKRAEWMPHGYLLLPGTVDFTLLLPPLDGDRVGAVELHLRGAISGSVAGTGVKNQRTGEYLKLMDGVTRLPNWQEYVSPVGLIELRYEVTAHTEILPPTVAVKGVGR